MRYFVPNRQWHYQEKWLPKNFSASLPWRFTFACCKNLETMMYHVPIDISTSMNRVDLATKSPSRQRASRP